MGAKKVEIVEKASKPGDPVDTEPKRKASKETELRLSERKGKLFAVVKNAKVAGRVFVVNTADDSYVETVKDLDHYKKLREAENVATAKWGAKHNPTKYTQYLSDRAYVGPMSEELVTATREAVTNAYKVVAKAEKDGLFKTVKVAKSKLVTVIVKLSLD
jgi:hypothetical protein